VGYSRIARVCIGVAVLGAAGVLAQSPLAEPPGTSAGAPRSPSLAEEFSKQSQIYQSKGENVPEGYVVDRSLLSYAFTLSPEFDRALAHLGETDRWLDIGAGQGQAVLDYYGERFDAMHAKGRERRGKKARAVALSIEDRRTAAWAQTAARLEKNQIDYLWGRRLREYTREELGSFQLVSDVIGGFSYTAYLSQFVTQVLDLLKVNGSFHSLLLDVHYEHGGNRPHYPDAAFRTEIVNAEGREVKVCAWLKQISCVQVTCEARPQWTPPIEVYTVRKVCDDVKVPSLAALHFEAGTPPERRYRLEQTPAARAAPLTPAR
jgi:SAM-dependent methyltransferase